MFQNNSDYSDKNTIKYAKNRWNKINFECNPHSVMPLLFGTCILPTVDKIAYQCLDLLTEFTAR